MSAVVNHGIFFNNKVGTSKTIKKRKKQKIKQTNYFYNKVDSSKTTGGDHIINFGSSKTTQ